MMPSYYWIKLYHEILDDPKMGRLSDRLWRRSIELFLLAGDLDQEGILPHLKDMAWRLRLSVEFLESDLVELAKVGIVSQSDGTWSVTNFAKRQSSASNKQRQQQYRDRKRKEQYYNNDSVTSRYTDIDTDTDREEETETERETNESTPFSFIQKVIETTTGLPAANKQAIDSINELVNMKATADDIRSGYAWLCKQDKQVKYYGQLIGPTRTAMAKRLKTKRQYKPPEETAEERHKRYILPQEVRNDL